MPDTRTDARADARSERRRDARRGARLPLTPPERRDQGVEAPSTPGEILRAARLRRRISLTEAERATRIRQRYLQALEDDDYGVLPTGVYSVGFLRNYAVYLGVPPDDVLTGVDPRRRREQRVGVQSVAPPIQLTAPRTTWLFAGGAAVALLLLALAWIGLSDPGTPTAAGPTSAAATPRPVTTPTALVSLPPLAPAVTATVPPTPQAAAQSTALPGATAAATGATTTTAQTTATAATATANPSRVEVELRAVDRVWVRATVDGNLALEETLAAGQTRRWSGARSVALRVGNGAGVDVAANGRPVGPLGPAGQPVDREFTR